MDRARRLSRVLDGLEARQLRDVFDAAARRHAGPLCKAIRLGCAEPRPAAELAGHEARSGDFRCRQRPS
ncbi:MAG: hypothetical protein HYZ20_18910 [Burkholderiales bacterium]|nr:hypothetical protein [Burkholderiales bacterium]